MKKSGLNDVNGEMYHPITYVSAICTASQILYLVLVKEAFAVYWALRNMALYLKDVM